MAARRRQPIESLLEALESRVADLSISVEKMRIADYVHLLERPGRLFWLNFIGGVGRGLGIAVGASVLGALLLFLLQRAVVLNIPLIGSFIAEIVKIVQKELVSG